MQDQLLSKLRVFMEYKKALLKYKCRIGKKPFFFEVSDIENLDIDNKHDVEILKYFLNKILIIKCAVYLAL